MADAAARSGVVDAVTAYWNARAPKFDAAASHVRDAEAWTAALEASFGPGGPRDVVDLGTGTGACALIAAELGHRVRAVDSAVGMIEVARHAAQARNLKVEFDVAPIDASTLAPESVDIVTLRNVLWTQPDPIATMNAAHRLLRAGGRVIVSDAHWDAAPAGRSTYPAELVRALPFHRGLLESEAREMLTSAGFTGIQSWQHLFARNPYSSDPPLPFFLLSAMRG